jgi:hypothetical protein
MIKPNAYGCFALLCTDETGTQVAIPLFRVMSEQISISNTIAKHPLDSGLFVNDHVTYEPETFDAAFAINGSPIVEAKSIETFKQSADQSRYIYNPALTNSRGRERHEAYRLELTKYRNCKWELNTTRNGILDDYMIASMTFNAADSGETVELRINFQKVRFATSSSVLLPTIPQAVKAAATAAGKGSGGMSFSEIFGGMDFDWNLGEMIGQLPPRSLLLDLAGAGEIDISQSPASYGDTSDFGSSVSEAPINLETSTP